MTHDELKEAVARAMWDRRFGDDTDRTICTWGQAHSEARGRFREMATAALSAITEALKEPTPGTVDAGNVPIECRRDCNLGVIRAAHTYRAMLAASPLYPEKKDD